MKTQTKRDLVLFALMLGLTAVTVYSCEDALAGDDLSYQIRDANKWPDHNRIDLERYKTYVNPLPCITHPLKIVGHTALITVPLSVCGTDVKIHDVSLQPIGEECAINARHGADVKANKVLISDARCGIYASESQVRFSNGYIFETRGQSVYQGRSIVELINVQMTQGITAINNSYTVMEGTFSENPNTWDHTSGYNIGEPQ